MSDNERLEVIKEIFGIQQMQTFSDRKNIVFNLDDLGWLIEQAEKVERYEKALLEIANSPYGLREVMVNTAQKALVK
ncbi:hypothetical protein [Bacillus litorisediminis]|uniref:hypothetical protein n=1 Tax=Bacillus litorisediminis TaxID=2922713 RepID=UPI001FAD92E9|nr:hypothetical protein [Bacillus litorisediminis]